MKGLSYATWMVCAFLSGVGACGGGSSSAASGPSWDCMSRCPNDNPQLSPQATCVATLDPGPCTNEIAAENQCRHDRQVCTSKGTTDEAATDQACTAERD